MADVVESKKKDVRAWKQHEFCCLNGYNGEKKRKNHVFLYALSIFLLTLAVYARFFAKNEGDEFRKLEWAFSEMKIAKQWINLAKEKFTSLSFINAVLFGLIMTTFTWMVVYFDSLLPGKCPPSPFSPRKLRKQSGHTFHNGYVLAVVNGFTCAFLLCWM